MFRRPQFSLKTLLLLPVAVAIFFGGMATQRRFLEKERDRLDALIVDVLKVQAEEIDIRDALQEATKRADALQAAKPPLDSGLRRKSFR